MSRSSVSPCVQRDGLQARPFLKWVGGKRQLIPTLRHYVPSRFNRYFEPFVGAGALFFSIGPARAVLGDINPRLMRTYRAIQQEVDAVIARLESFPHDREFFLQMRSKDIDAESDVEVAAWMIYLNKTAYNGLYRVNRSGRFNVPFGRYVNPNICDAPNLRRCAKALKKAELVEKDFAFLLRRVRKDDFVYFDPPYIPLSPTSNFTSYTQGGFTLDDQIRLRDVALELKRRGAHVLLSNSNASEVKEIFGGHFRISNIDGKRAINSIASGRGAVRESVIY